MTQGTDSRRRGLQRLASAVVIAMAVTVVVATLVLPRMVGGAALTVLTGSMEPTYPVGSLVIVRPIEADEVVTGDAITFANPSGSFTTHRVTTVNLTPEGERSFTTKGDANAAVDNDPVPADAVRGRVWFHVPYLGHVREALSSPTGLAAIVGLVSLTLVWDRASSFVRRRVRRPAWLSDRIIDSSPAAASTAAPNKPQEQLDPSPTVHAVPPSDADPIREETGLVDPIPVSGPSVDLHPTARVEQQLMLARLNAGAFARGKVIELLGLVRGHVVSIGTLHMVVTVTGTPEHLDGVEDLLRSCGLVEASRSAVVYVGGAPAPETEPPPPPESVATLDTNLKALVLRPPAPPGLAAAASNGHSHEGSDQ